MRILVANIVLSTLCIVALRAQPQPVQKIIGEISVPSLPRYEMDIILKGERSYVPARELFQYLGIKLELDSVNQRLSGFWVSPETSYQINLPETTASIGKRFFTFSQEDYLSQEGKLFVSVSLLESLFEIGMRYNPRRLRIEIKDYQLVPALITARKLRAFRPSGRARTFPEPELYIGRELAPIKGGRLDYNGASSFSKSQHLGSAYTLSLGAKVAGGDLTGRLNAFTGPFQNTRRLRGKYRMPFFSTSLLRQITIGDFFSTSPISSRDITGIEITNRPAGERRKFTREVYNGVFEPNVEVGLSGGIEGPRLQQTDETGLYQFDVPLIYGLGYYEIHAFDQWGQERVLRFRENIPRSLIPPGELEYSFSAGKARQPLNSAVVNTAVSYGFSSNLTIGGTIDYYDLESVNRKFYAGLTTTSRITPGLVFNGIVVPAAYSRASFDWQFPSSTIIRFSNIRYNVNKFFNPAQVVNDASLLISLPFYPRNHNININLFGEQIVFPTYRNDELQMSVADAIGVVTARLGTLLSWRQVYGDDRSLQQHLSNGALVLYLPAGIVVRGEAQYDHRTHVVDNMFASVLKSLGTQLHVEFDYYRVPLASLSYYGLQLRYYFSFLRAQAGAVTYGSSNYKYSIGGSGSVSFDLTRPLFSFRNTANVGSSGFEIRPFYDANGNGIYDKGEQAIDKIRTYYSNTTLGTAPSQLSSRRFVVEHLKPYDEYDLYIDAQSLDNPLWVPEFTGLRFLAEPNLSRLVEIPVVPGGIIRGLIFYENDTAKTAPGITVLLKNVGSGGNNGTHVVKKVVTFSTGEFEFSSVPPGKYEIVLDEDQLKSLGYRAEPAKRQIEIVRKEEGDIEEHLDFRLLANR